MIDPESKSGAKPGLLRRFKECTSGNALVLAAFGMPMVIGAGGFGIDFAQYYLWQRELQYATDQAAIAAAWELADNLSSTSYADRALLEFQANEQITATFNTSPTVTLANYAGKVGNSVVVTASATKTLPFTSFFTREPTTVSTRSQAAFTGGAITSQCLIATEDTDGSAVKLSGAAVFTAGCGIAALSSSEKICTTWEYPDTSSGACLEYTGEDAIVASPNVTIDAGTIAAKGTIDDILNDITDDVIIENAQGLTDPFEGLTPPIPDGYPEGRYACRATGKNKDAQTELLGKAYPGVYSGGLAVSCDTTFQPGVYVIDGGTLRINGNYSVIGSDIMFVLTNGAGFILNGTANTGESQDVNLQGITESTLMSAPYYVDAADAQRMDGMLIFEDPESPGSNPSGEGVGNQFNGTHDTWMSGSIYLPKSSLTLAGTASVANRCLLMVANKVTLTGTTDLTDFCPDGYSHETVIIYGTVKLVA